MLKLQQTVFELRAESTLNIENLANMQTAHKQAVAEADYKSRQAHEAEITGLRADLEAKQIQVNDGCVLIKVLEYDLARARGGCQCFLFSASTILVFALFSSNFPSSAHFIILF